MSFDRFLLAVESQYLKLTKVLYECLLSQAEWWVAELLLLSLNNWGLTFLQNKCSQSSEIYLSPEKLRKVFTFQSCKFLDHQFCPNCQVLNSFFGIMYSSATYHTALGKKTLLYYFFQLRIDRSRNSTAKRNLSKDM